MPAGPELEAWVLKLRRRFPTATPRQIHRWLFHREGLMTRESAVRLVLQTLLRRGDLRPPSPGEPCEVPPDLPPVRPWGDCPPQASRAGGREAGEGLAQHLRQLLGEDDPLLQALERQRGALRGAA